VIAKLGAGVRLGATSEVSKNKFGCAVAIF
jgi:hypothetical protein